MPTYDYFCQSCDAALEIFHSMSEPARTTCPECAEETLKRKVGGGTGIIFKGSGFYETDYKRPQKTSESTPKETAQPKTDSKCCGGGCKTALK